MKKKNIQKAKQVRDVKSRHTKFVGTRKRIARLAAEIKFFDEVGRADDEVAALQEQLKNKIKILERGYDLFYSVAEDLNDDMKIYVAELRYIDGLSWTEISDSTGLHVQTLYNYNKQILKLFSDAGHLNLIINK